MSTTAPTPEQHWQTTLFLPRPGTTAPTDTISPRLAYQHTLFGRAVVVDLRPDADRTLAPDAPTAPDLPTALASAAPVVVVLGDAPLPTTPRVRPLAGGLAAWVEAGLPVAA